MNMVALSHLIAERRNRLLSLAIKKRAKRPISYIVPFHLAITKSIA